MHRMWWFTLVIFLSSLLLQACGRDGFAAVEGTAYLHRVNTETVKIELGYLVEREFAGLVKANQNSDLGFELAGRVDRLFVNEGDTVSQGQVLARLDNSLLLSQQDELKARADALISELSLASRNLQRVQQLRQDGLASEREGDELSNRVQVLQASLRELEAAQKANQLRLDKSVLLAPFAARIGSRRVDSGTVVDAGTPVFSLVESGAREVRVGIPPALFSGLQNGDRITVRSGEESIRGTVLARGAAVDPSTRTRPLRILVDALWTPGELAYAQLDQRVELKGAWISETAVTEGIRGTWIVYVAVPQGDATALLETRSVTVHHSAGQRLYVSGALDSGEMLVSNGLHRLAPRQLVKTGAAESFAHVP
jgi:RND family efflux transporter MFP subunit